VKLSELTNEQTTKRPNRRSSLRRRAILVSVTVHALLAVVLLSWYLPTSERKETAGARIASAPIENRESKVDRGEPRNPQPPIPPVEVTPERIEKSLESHISQFEKLSDQQKLSQLEKNLQRLESVSDPESIQEVTTTIASALGVDQQQYAPQKTPAEGTFDTKTSQLQDVVRTRGESGDWKYESVMVDSAGRTMTVPMNGVEGETVYKTFEQMKKYPLAAGIYRGVVMPLIQKMIEAEQLAKQASVEAERLRRAAQTSEIPKIEKVELGIGAGD
jgi:hypothetical protein